MAQTRPSKVNIRPNRGPDDAHGKEQDHERMNDEDNFTNRQTIRRLTPPSAVWYGGISFTGSERSEGSDAGESRCIRSFATAQDDRGPRRRYADFKTSETIR